MTETTVETTDPSVLPQWNGRPVPWVTRWTGETSRAGYSVQVTRTGARIAYPDGPEVREKSGVLWQREGLTRAGEPDWANVNTYRQRLSMTRQKCQVCGTKIEERPIRWLMPLDGLEVINESADGAEVITIQPPTCSACIPLALELCPHLKKHGYQILRVLDYEVWGVFGEVVVNEDGQPRRLLTCVQYDAQDAYGEHFSYERVLAKQQVAKLGKYVVEEFHEPA